MRRRGLAARCRAPLSIALAHARFAASRILAARLQLYSLADIRTREPPVPLQLTLVSHPLCPYVQRAAIVLREKGVPFTRRDIDLADKPDWFLRISPLGKTPVLLAGDTPIFESAVICEYLDEAQTRPEAPRLHPEAPLARAQHRAWMEFGSAVLNGIAAFYTAPDDAALAARAQDLRRRFTQLEAELGDGPYFDGARFCMVDAVFGPVFRYFDVFDTIDAFGVLDDLPKVGAWRSALTVRPSVRDAVGADYAARLRTFLLTRGSALSRRTVAGTVN
ncbi:glutathione S-transferase [Ralstonia sp. 151470066-2]